MLKSTWIHIEISVMGWETIIKVYISSAGQADKITRAISQSSVSPRFRFARARAACHAGTSKSNRTRIPRANRRGRDRRPIPRTQNRPPQQHRQHSIPAPPGERGPQHNALLPPPIECPGGHTARELEASQAEMGLISVCCARESADKNSAQFGSKSLLLSKSGRAAYQRVLDLILSAYFADGYYLLS